ncbi:MAG TPA: hypothetical protein VLI45_08135, partial [Acidobacteriaceae bacterium]|nr:hypothetical protein [Acidobacteriaceae bacterium]
TREGSTVFETARFNRSRTSPRLSDLHVGWMAAFIITIELFRTLGEHPKPAIGDQLKSGQRER